MGFDPSNKAPADSHSEHLSASPLNLLAKSKSGGVMNRDVNSWFSQKDKSLLAAMNVMSEYKTQLFIPAIVRHQSLTAMHGVKEE